MRIAIDAQVTPGGEQGGVEQFVMSLIHALGKLDDGLEEYVIIVRPKHVNWLKPYLGGNQHLIVRSSNWDSVRNALGPLRKPARRLLQRARRALAVSLPESNGFYELLGAEVLHIPHQRFVRCLIPTIYNPHDLQYLHYPQFFMPAEIAEREIVYSAGCRYAQTVATDSQWVRHDVVRQFEISPDKVFAIPMGSPTTLYAALTDQDVVNVKRGFRLPETFALYPAQTWKHKNHPRLLEAIASLRDRDGIIINLVCTGKRGDFWHALQKQVRHLGLVNQVQFLGFVTPVEIRALYHLAQFIMYPSLFEGGGLPILEAFYEGTPVACSSVTSLPEYAGDAALFFNPTSTESIANALKQMTTNSDLRAELTQRGNARIKQFTWERTAKMYRALYRKVAGRPLSMEDQELLANGT